MRKENDSAKFSGTVRLNFDISKDVNTVLVLTNQLRLQYVSGKNKLLFINDYRFKKLNSNRFNNRNLQHIRYNYLLNNKITLESFIQRQQDEILGINNRTLVGLGPRFEVSNSKEYQFYLGTLVMQEYENSKGKTENIIEQATRGNIYISSLLQPNKIITIAGTLYYQPKINLLSDYRIAMEASISLKLIKNLFFTSTLTYQKDTFPIFNIPEEQYRLENGFTYTF